MENDGTLHTCFYYKNINEIQGISLSTLLTFCSNTVLTVLIQGQNSSWVSPVRLEDFTERQKILISVEISTAVTFHVPRI